MIKLSENAKASLSYSYTNPIFPRHLGTRANTDADITLFNNTVFPRYMEVDLTTSQPVIPVNLLNYVYHSMIKTGSYSDLLLVTLPIRNSYRGVAFKTAYSIIRHISNEDNRQGAFRLIKYVSEKHGTYYGNTSLMLNSDFEVIFYRGFKLPCPIQEIRDTLMDRVRIFREYCAPVFYVNPKFYIEQSDIVSKYMVKSMIPYYLYTDIEVIFQHLDIIRKPNKNILRYDNFNEIINDDLVNYSKNIIFDI